jgi:hypothetical protein
VGPSLQEGEAKCVPVIPDEGAGDVRREIERLPFYHRSCSFVATSSNGIPDRNKAAAPETGLAFGTRTSPRWRLPSYGE